jgi:hypothetical protein
MSAIWRSAAVVLVWAAAALAQHGTTPRPTAEGYAVRVEAGPSTVAAGYLVHTVSSGGQSFLVPEHLVVEVAVYPAKGQRPVFSSGLFTLRINAKKEELFPQAPGMVAASLKYSDWERRRSTEVSLGAGDGGIILGRPHPAERFPGDRRPAETGGQSPRVETRRTDQSGEPALEVAEAVQEWAFPDGECAGPVSGFLYFAWKGKPKSIRSLELILHRGEERTILKLF